MFWVVSHIIRRRRSLYSGGLALRVRQTKMTSLPADSIDLGSDRADFVYCVPMPASSETERKCHLILPLACFTLDRKFPPNTLRTLSSLLIESRCYWQHQYFYKKTDLYTATQYQRANLPDTRPNGCHFSYRAPHNRGHSSALFSIPQPFLSMIIVVCKVNALKEE
jgi:hypothetical protein